MAGDSLNPVRNPSRCVRAREWVSLRADGELSELERLLLRRHIARCVECRAFAEGVKTTTAVLRAAPAASPSRSLAPRVRQERFRLRYRLATALVVFSAALGVLLGSIREGPAPGPPPPPEISLLDPDAQRPGGPANPRAPERPIEPPAVPV